MDLRPQSDGDLVRSSRWPRNRPLDPWVREGLLCCVLGPGLSGVIHGLRLSDCSKQIMRVGCLAKAVGLLALRATASSGGTGWWARGLGRPTCEVGAGPHRTRDRLPSGRPRRRWDWSLLASRLPAAVCALHRVLISSWPRTSTAAL